MKILRNSSIGYAELKIGSDAVEYSRRLHSHPEPSIAYIEDGSTRVRVRQTDFFLEPGDVLFIPPEYVHLCEPEDGPVYRFAVLYVGAGWFRETFDTDPGGIPPLKKSVSEPGLRDLPGLFRDFSNADPLEFETGLILLLENLLEGHLGRQDAEGCAEAGRSLELVRERIERGYGENPSLDELAAVGNMNRYTLVRLFRAVYRLTPHACLLNVRINRARELLLGPSTVADIAAECGFVDQSHFVKTFRAYVGIAPSEYRKK